MKNRLSAVAASVALALPASFPVFAGGSNYGITPGTLPNVTGKVSEWPVPTPRFARDPAPGPDGNIYITVMNGNKIARFDTKTHAFKEWELAAGHRPHGLLVDKQGIVWTTGNGNGTLGRLDLPDPFGIGPLRLYRSESKVWNDIAVDRPDSHLLMLESFVDAIVKNGPVPASAAVPSGQ